MVFKLLKYLPVTSSIILSAYKMHKLKKNKILMGGDDNQNSIHKHYLFEINLLSLFIYMYVYLQKYIHQKQPPSCIKIIFIHENGDFLSAIHRFYYLKYKMRYYISFFYIKWQHVLC